MAYPLSQSTMQGVNLHAKKSKCTFLVPSVSYLGYKIDGEGLHPLPEKVKSIQDAPTPRNSVKLKSYLGLLTYYGKFLPNLSTHIAPFYQLLCCNTKWKWSGAQEKAFQKSKTLLVSSNLLIPFNPDLPLVLACDASQYGLGAVLAHWLPDGHERPIGYASRTLNAVEWNYYQLELEGLACGVKRFYSYLFGHSFQLITDHKQLLGLLSECKSTSPQASVRIRRWSLYLSQFEYCFTFRRTTAHANADALSRLPLPVQPEIQQPPVEMVLLCQHPMTLPSLLSTSKLNPTKIFCCQTYSSTFCKVGQTLSPPNLLCNHSLSINLNCLCTKDALCVDLMW